MFGSCASGSLLVYVVMGHKPGTSKAPYGDLESSVTRTGPQTATLILDICSPPMPFFAPGRRPWSLHSS